jgi:hypothetical protein
MHGRKKEWVIDVDGSSLRDAERAAALERARRFADHASESTASTEEGYYVLGPVPDRTRMLLLLTYALGPAAPVLTQTGRRQIVWAVLGLLGVPLWVGMLWKWPVLSGWLAAGRVPLLPWLLVSALLFCLTFAAWSRSVFLTGWDARFFAERLPSWLQNPAIVGLLGLVAPGAGLLVSAAPRRAAIAVGNAGLTLLAAAIVVSAPLLWKCNQLTSSGAIPPRALEMLFIAAFAATIVGSLMWFTHALDGARLATYRSGRRTHRRGDWFAVAVLAALVTFFVTFEPRSLAHDLDRHAQSMQSELWPPRRRLLRRARQEGASAADSDRPPCALAGVRQSHRSRCVRSVGPAVPARIGSSRSAAIGDRVACRRRPREKIRTLNRLRCHRAPLGTPTLAV